MQSQPPESASQQNEANRPPDSEMVANHPLPSPSPNTPTPDVLLGASSALQGRPPSAARSRINSFSKSPGSLGGASTSAPKVSLAGAFSSATESRFQMLESQISIERLRLEREDARAAKQDELEQQRVSRTETREERREAREDARWTQQLQWERERYARDEARAKDKEEKEERLRQEKKAMILDLLQQGKTPHEAEAIMRLVFS